MFKKLLFFLIFISINLAYASEIKQNIDIEADAFHIDEETGIIIAEGNVNAKKDDVILWTDKIIYNKETGIITIPGNFKLYRDILVEGKGLIYNIKEKKGNIEVGSIFLFSDDPTKRRFFSGSNITLLDRESALIQEGIASSCEGDDKQWYIKGKDLRIKAGQYLTGKHVTLKFYDIPLFYTPYFIAPVKTEKESGLLFPTFGLSGEHGFIFKQPVYIVIDDSKDITSNIRLRTKDTFGLENQFRYMLSANEEGEFVFNLLDNYDKHKLFYLMNWKHRENEQYLFDADITYFNPNTYFREYEDDSAKRNNPYLRSTAFIEKRIDQEILEADLLLTKRALILGDASPYQKLEIQNQGLIQNYKGFLYNYNLSLTGFSDSQNEQHLRASINGTNFLIKIFPNFKIALDTSIKYNAYSRSIEKGEFSNKGSLTFIPSALFDKGYVVNEKYIVLNTFKPFLKIPLLFAEDAVKNLDEKDMFEKSKKIILNFEEKWYDLATFEQFFYIFLSQSYVLTDREQDTPLSNLNLTVRYTKKAFSLFSEADYSHASGRVAKAIFGANYNSDFTKISLSYNFQYKLSEFISLDLWQKMGHQLAFTGKLRYDIVNGYVREVSIGSEMKKNCYSLTLNLVRRTLPTEYLILFNLNLYGLGEIKQNI
jgi:lipopolysaccharide assembly outer membrane protein LptD (OstA)